jgi:hypothetical protein
MSLSPKEEELKSQSVPLLQNERFSSLDELNEPITRVMTSDAKMAEMFYSMRTNPLSKEMKAENQPMAAYSASLYDMDNDKFDTAGNIIVKFHKQYVIACNPEESFDNRIYALRFLDLTPYVRREYYLEKAICSFWDTTHDKPEEEKYNTLFGLVNPFSNFAVNVCYNHIYKSTGGKDDTTGITQSKIDSAIYLLQSTHEIEYHEYLLEHALDQLGKYRSKCADALSRIGLPKYALKGREILMELGGLSNVLYNNEQNIHMICDNSMKLTIKAVMDNITLDDENIKYADELYVAIFTLCKQHVSISTMMEAYRYLLTDRYIFYGATSKDILFRYWHIMRTQLKESQDNFIQRVGEELVDMWQTCTTGYFIRVINMGIGFDELKDFIFIQFEADVGMKSTITHRIQQLLSTMDQDEAGIVLAMMIDKDDPSVIDFVQSKDMLDLKEKLKNEHSNLTSEIDFELTFAHTVNEMFNLSMR